MNKKFSDLKERILAIAKSAHACKEQYKRAYSSESAGSVDSGYLSVDSGYILVDNDTVVEALDNGTIYVWDNATVVEASDKAIYRTPKYMKEKL